MNDSTLKDMNKVKEVLAKNKRLPGSEAALLEESKLDAKAAPCAPLDSS